MNREQLKEILPHREPMLLVDEAWVNPDGSATGLYTVRGDEYFLQGHFPGHPIVPGVIQCEILAQSASILFEELLREGKYMPLFGGMNKVKFRNQVRPGDQMKIDISLMYVKHPYYMIKGEVKVNETVCMNGEFSIVMIPRGDKGGM